MVYSEYVITDSGGIQEEAYFLKKKCIVLNDSTGLLHTIGVSGTIIGDKFERIKEIINEGS